MGAAAADFLRNAVLREVERVDEALVGAGFFHGVEVFTLEVFDERDLARLGVVVFAHERRDLFEAGEFRGAPAAFAGDELVAVRGFPHEDGLEDAVGRDARAELLERGLVEVRARLEAVLVNVEHRDLEHAVRLRLEDGLLVEKCPEAFASEAAVFSAHVSAPPLRVLGRPLRPSNACRSR